MQNVETVTELLNILRESTAVLCLKIKIINPKIITLGIL